MKKLIICEKPSVSRAFCKTLYVSNKYDGYFENEEYIITYAFGHLISLCYPEAYDKKLENWSFDTLPFLPEAYKYAVINDEGTKHQFEIIKRLYHRSDISTIYYAPDPAREGIYIQYLIMRMAGVPDSVDQRVIWIDSQTDEEIRKGIRNAKPRRAYDLMADSGYMRAIEDYATGINLSRALTLKYGKQVNDAVGRTKGAIAVGRVMTCVQGMIVRREREIRAFEATKFYRVIAATKDGNEFEWKYSDSSHITEDLRYGDKGFLSEENALAFIQTLQNSTQPFTVKSSTAREEKKGAKLLFNIAELQNECSKLFKISPDLTLAIAQTLYERKLTTYPRTDARYLSSAIAKEIVNNLCGLELIEEVGPLVTQIREMGTYQTIGNTKYTNDAKINDHYAIIPTGDVFNLSGLNELERNVYMLIVRRFLAIFFPPAVYNAVTCSIECMGEVFNLQKKQLQEPGYMVVTGVPKQEGEGNLESLLKLKAGDIISVDLGIKEGSTQPPKRYTSGSIILAMENAGNLIEDEELREQIKDSGIGTSATRDAILTKLQKNGYIHLNKKTQILTPEPYGEVIYDVVDLTIPSFLVPKMTASWEKGLSQIEAGTIPKQKYQQMVDLYITKEVEAIKNSNLSEQLKDRISAIDFTVAGEKVAALTCPKCGKPLRLNKKGDISCSSYVNKENIGCGFYMFGHFFEKKLTESQLVKLLKHKKVTGVALTSKSGRKYKGTLLLDENYRISLDTSGWEEKPTLVDDGQVHRSKVICPKCREKLLRKGDYLFCNCGYRVKNTYSGKTLDDETMNSLLSGHALTYTDFLSKNFKTFTATLVVDKNHNVIMEFEKRKRKKKNLWESING